MRRCKEDAEQTRIAVLDAAEGLFCTHGIAAATLEKVARAAGVTRGAVYWHFRDKTDLLRALHERSRPPQKALIELAAVNGHDDPLGLLEQAAAEMLAIFEQNERQQRMFMIMNMQSPDEESSAWARAVNADMTRSIIRLTQHARKAGSLTAEFTPEEAAAIMISTMTGLLHEWLRSGKSFALADLGRRLLRRQMEMLRHKPVN